MAGTLIDWKEQPVLSGGGEQFDYQAGGGLAITNMYKHKGWSSLDQNSLDNMSVIDFVVVPSGLMFLTVVMFGKLLDRPARAKYVVKVCGEHRS